MGLILIDADGRVALWNQWIAKRSGISTETALNQSLDALFSSGLSASFKTALGNSLSYKLPIVLSNALHHAPLPLYPLPLTPEPRTRLHQSITLTPLMGHNEAHFCLIQVTDTSMFIKREKVLKLQSDQFSLDATTDSLTGAYNRRSFDERLQAEFRHAQRVKSPLSLLMLDIDYFKNYNDTYGHPAGDQVLISVVNTIKSQLHRPSDIVTRYGGEEFAVILPDCGIEGSLSVAKTLLQAINTLNIPHSQSEIADHVTISIGASTLDAAAKTNTDQLLKSADAALYQAKNAGRNRAQHLLIQTCVI